MKRLGRFLMAALKVTLGFFVWLFRAVFKWVMCEEAGNCPPLSVVRFRFPTASPGRRRRLRSRRRP